MHLKLLSDDNMSKKMVLYGLCFRNSLWGISINENDCTWYGLYLRSYFFGGKATFAVLLGSNPNVRNEILHFESKVKLWKAQCTTKFIKSPEIIKKQRSAPGPLGDFVNSSLLIFQNLEITFNLIWEFPLKLFNRTK